MAKPKLDVTKVAGYREKLEVNQSVLWSSLGVTQSGGSRFESGRNLPKPVAQLLTLRETGKISEADLAMADAVIQKAKK